MSTPEHPFSPTRIPLVAGAVVAVRSRPWLAYVVAIMAFCLAAYVWIEGRSEAERLRVDEQKIERQAQRLEALQRQVQRQIDDLTLRGRQLDELQTRMAHWDSQLNAAQRRAWVLSETTHYLRLADQHLALTRDIVGARTLLEVADRLLAAEPDAALLPLRQAIARDRQQLGAALAVDTAGLYLRLGAVSERIAGLVVPTLAMPVQRASSRQTQTAESEQGAANWAWQRLRQLMVIRHHEAELQPLRSAEDQALVRESLRLDLAQAQLALLRGDAVIYQQALTTAQQRLVTYFSRLPAAELDDLRQEMRALAAITIRPALPDIAQSVKAAEALSRQQTGASPASAKSLLKASRKAAGARP